MVEKYSSLTESVVENEANYCSIWQPLNILHIIQWQLVAPVDV